MMLETEARYNNYLFERLRHAIGRKGNNLLKTPLHYIINTANTISRPIICFPPLTNTSWWAYGFIKSKPPLQCEPLGHKIHRGSHSSQYSLIDRSDLHCRKRYNEKWEQRHRMIKNCKSIRTSATSAVLGAFALVAIAPKAGTIDGASALVTLSSNAVAQVSACRHVAVGWRESSREVLAKKYPSYRWMKALEKTLVTYPCSSCTRNHMQLDHIWGL